jgi:hypothetical protein
MGLVQRHALDLHAMCRTEGEDRRDRFVDGDPGGKFSHYDAP